MGALLMCKRQPQNNNIVYLFNSAYRGTYAFNLFKIMASQGGLYATLRYSLGKNVPEELGNPVNFKKFKNCRCFIIFINRYNDKKYEFLPIRKGTIHKIHADSGYLFVNVKLDEYISFESGASEFTNLLTEKLKGKNIPELKDNNPEITTDGNYIVESDQSIDKDVVSNHESWLKTVEYIGKTKAFDEKFTFIKVNFCRTKKDNSYVLVSPDVNGVISISPRNSYVIDITYFDPTLGKGSFSFNFNYQNPLVGMQQKIYCASKIDNVSILISSGKNISLSDKPCSIEVAQVENSIERCVLTIPCKVEPIWKNSIVILLVTMVFILAFGSELEQSSNFWLSLWIALKWLISLILIGYVGVRIF